MNTADPANPWSRLLTTPPTTTVESILRYPAHSHDYRRHLADYEATRIEPAEHSRSVNRYVPQDVRRWWDPAHRAAMKDRARAYAALQPEARR